MKRIDLATKAPVDRARWLEAPFQGSVVFCNELTLDEPLDGILAFAAAPAFRIVLDGQTVAHSSIQPTREQIFYEPFRLELPAGRHQLEVLVVDDQGHAPLSRVHRKRGFFCVAYGEEGKLFNTGLAPWKCRREPRYSFQPQILPEFQCVGGVLTADFRIPVPTALHEPVAFEKGADAWTFTQTEVDCRRLSPAPLPPFSNAPVGDFKIRQVDTVEGPYREANAPLDRNAFEVPPHSFRRILLELDDYYCVDYELAISGGLDGEVQVAWAEGLFESPETQAKCNRAEIEGKYFRGLCDRFLPGPQRSVFFNIDYRAGRYIELQIRTADEPLSIERFDLRENRYPLEWNGSLETGDARLDHIARMAFRTLQMCSHDTFMDCPYYEQLMYIGDGRLQLLTAYVTSGDLRLTDHAMLLWGEGLRNEGLFASFYPARQTQIIPSFSMLYVAAVADYVRWRNRPEVTSRIFPLAVRSLMALESMMDGDGLLRMTRGWLFVDWAEGWEKGEPPMRDGVSCVFNALYLYILKEFREACEMLGEQELAQRFGKIAKTLSGNVLKKFYRAQAGAFSDLPDTEGFSEHANSLMLLSGCLPEDLARQVADTMFQHRVPMTRATVYFSFYYMEAAMRCKRPDAFFERVGIWRDMEPLGLKTLLESPEPSRSDCHAWSSHVLYHLFASVAGLRPTEAGGCSFRCNPQMGPLNSLKGSMPTGSQKINFEIDRTGDAVCERV